MIIKVEMLLDSDLGDDKMSVGGVTALLDRVFTDNDHIAKIIICDVKGEKEIEKIFCLERKEVEYLVNNIQHEYLNKDTYYFARDLFNRMEQFIKENGK